MTRSATLPTQRQIAEALGIDPALVTRYKARGMPVDSIRAAAQWKAENVAARATFATAVDVAQSALMEARTQREAAEAARAALRLGEEAGELVRVDTVFRELAGIVASTRDALLQIPDRLAVVIASEPDAARVRELVAADLTAALSLLDTAPAFLQQRHTAQAHPDATGAAAGRRFT